MRRNLLLTITALLFLNGCDKFGSAKPKATGDSAAAYTFTVGDVSSELAPGADFVINFSERAPQARGSAGAVTATAAETIVVTFDFGDGVVVECENPTISNLILRCRIPATMPDGSPKLKIMVDNRALALKRNGVLLDIKVRMNRSLAYLPRLTAPASSGALTISSVTKVGGGAIAAGDQVLITGTGFTATGPIQFYFSPKHGGLQNLCQPRVVNDGSAHCVVPAGTSGAIKLWGEVVADPRVQGRYASALTVSP